MYDEAENPEECTPGTEDENLFMLERPPDGPAQFDETEYLDTVVAPVLQDLADKCSRKKLTFLAVVNYGRANVPCGDHFHDVPMTATITGTHEKRDPLRIAIARGILDPESAAARMLDTLPIAGCRTFAEAIKRINSIAAGSHGWAGEMTIPEDGSPIEIRDSSGAPLQTSPEEARLFVQLHNLLAQMGTPTTEVLTAAQQTLQQLQSLVEASPADPEHTRKVDLLNDARTLIELGLAATGIMEELGGTP